MSVQRTTNKLVTSPSRAEASYSSSSSLSTVYTQVCPDLIILHGGLHVVVVRGVPGLVPCAALGCSRVLASSLSSPLQQLERDLAAEAADVLPFLADSRPAAPRTSHPSLLSAANQHGLRV